MTRARAVMAAIAAPVVALSYKVEEIIIPARDMMATETVKACINGSVLILISNFSSILVGGAVDEEGNRREEGMTCQRRPWRGLRRNEFEGEGSKNLSR
jgi:hypothetical protein